MADFQINLMVSKEKPKYGKTAAELLKKAREFYEDTENEKAFQEWMAERRREKCLK